jgi:hypothetical protein
MSKDIEYLLHNYLRSKGNVRAYKQLLMVLQCDMIYHTVKKQNKDE